MQAFIENPWTIAVLAPIIVAIVIYIFRLEARAKGLDSIENRQEAKQVQKVVINNHLPKQDLEGRAINQKETTSAEVNVLKQDTRVLFIDDLDLKKKIKNLKDAGWAKVSQLKDAPNIDISEIREADIIFIDYKGIGEIESGEQGLSILTALKNRYADSKYMVLYSAHDVPVDAFNRGANAYLSKNSTIYELEQKIIEGRSKIKK